jgi:hypothetical protein
MDMRQHYPSDLTDREWSQIERFIPAPKSGGRPAKYERREIVRQHAGPHFGMGFVCLTPVVQL